MKKISTWAGFLLLFITILIVAGFLVRNPVGYFILEKGAQVYARRAGIYLETGRVSGNLLTHTTIEQVVTHPEEGRPQLFDFRAQTIECTYDLWSLKEGYRNFLQGLHCTAQGPEFRYDQSLAPVQNGPAEEQRQFFIPAPLPGLALHDGSIILVHNDWDADLRGIEANLRSEGAAQELELTVAGFRFNREGRTMIDAGFSAQLQYAEGTLTVESLVMGDRQIKAAGSIDLSQLNKEHVEFAADIAFGASSLDLAGTWSNQWLRSHARTDNFDIAELLKHLGATGLDISGKIRGETEISVNLETLEQLDGSFTLNVQEGKMRGVTIERVAAAGSFDNSILSVPSVEMETVANHIIISDATVPILEFGKTDVLSALARSKARFKADINDMATLLELFRIRTDDIPDALRPNSLKISGRLAQGSVQVENGRALSDGSDLTIVRAMVPIPASGQTFQSIPLDIDARYEVADIGQFAGFWGDIPLKGKADADISITGNFKEFTAGIKLSGEHLDYGKMRFGSLELRGYAVISQESIGKIKSARITVTEMIQTNSSGILSLATPAKGSWQQDDFSIEATFQVDGKGETVLKIRKSAGTGLSGEITVLNLESSGFLDNFISGRYFFSGADLDVVLNGIPPHPQVQLSGSVSEAGGPEVPFPMAGNFNLQYSSKGIEISEFTWKSHERNQMTISGFLPYDPLATEPLLEGPLALEGDIDFPALEDIAFLLEPVGIGKGSVAVDIDLTGTWKEPEGQVILQVKGLEPPDRMRSYIDSPVNLTCEIEAKKKSIILKSATLDSYQYSAQATGSWQHGVSVRQLLQKRKAELQGDIAVDATVQFKDLNFLRRKLTWLRRLEGDMRGEIHIAGPVTDPTFKGSFSLKDGEASHTFNFPMLTDLYMNGEFDERSISINDMRAEGGGSPVNLNGKVVRDQEKVDVSLHINGKNVLLFRNNDMRLRGDVQLDVTGPLERLAVKGTTGLTSGYYTRNLDLLSMIGSSATPVSEGVSYLFSFTEPPLRDAVFDIKIATIEPFKIRNNVIRGALRPELTLRGTGELPYLVGTIYIDPSRVLLPSGGLQVQSGLLRFLEGEPDRPKLDLVAQSKILGYDINVVIQGPLDDPVISLSSSPALRNDELLLLLLTGQPPRKEGQEDVAGGLGSKGTTNIMVYLGRDFLNKWLEDESGAGGDTILDRFELDFGRDVTKSGEQTIESSFRLSKQITSTGRIYYLTGEKDKYDAYNYGLKLVFRFE
jgi:autotransporter translocation and assembly factor TamB